MKLISSKHDGYISTLIVEVYSKQYSLIINYLSDVVIHVKNVADNSDSRQIKMTGIKLNESNNDSRFLNSQLVHLEVLSLLKTLNLGFELELEEEDKDKLVAFMGELSNEVVTYDYKFEIEREIPESVFISSIKPKLVANAKYTCKGLYTIYITQEIGVIIHDSRRHKYYKIDIEDSIDAYLIFSFQLGDSTTNLKVICKKLGHIIDKYCDYKGVDFII